MRGIPLSLLVRLPRPALVSRLILAAGIALDAVVGMPSRILVTVTFWQMHDEAP